MNSLLIFIYQFKVIFLGGFEVDLLKENANLLTFDSEIVTLPM